MKLKLASKLPSKITVLLLAMAVQGSPSLGTVAAAVESAAELLEQGIYTEETVGDLAAAIEIYSRIVEDDEANRLHVAQAHYRLGSCYLKRGNDAEARTAFEKLIQSFPEQEQLVALAREQLAGAQPALALGPVPWKDGEFLSYRVSLPTGKSMGALYLRADSGVVNGIEAWQLEIRRLIFSDSNNFGVSRVLVDRRTQRPIRSTVRHGLLGNAEAAYGPDGVDITHGGTDTHVDVRQEFYDNEQSMHLMRMLPLEPGYKTQLRFLPTWVGEVIDVGLEVTGKEDCTVPAGDFECYVVDLEVGPTHQTVWYSTGPERYPLKQKAGGVILELAEVRQVDPEAGVAFGLEDFGFSGTLPTGWVVYEHRVRGRDNQAMVRFLDPDSEAISAVEVDLCPEGRCPTLQETAERELAGARKRIAAYELREGSWTERTIDGRPAISFVGDYEREGKPWVQYRIYTLTEKLRLELIFRAPAERFEALQATFDSIVESLEAG